MSGSLGYGALATEGIPETSVFLDPAGVGDEVNILIDVVRLRV